MNDSLGALLAIVFIWLVVKFAYGGSSPRSSDPTTGPPVTEGPGLGRRNRQVSQEMVDSLTTMFPHISESSIRYDLQRSGSVDVTCERILTEGRLPEPPAGLFAPTLTPTNQNQNQNRTNGNTTTNNNNNGTLTTPNSKASSSKKSPSLISRFGLESRLNQETGDDSSDINLGDVSVESLKGKEKANMGWGEEKGEREKRLRERKEKMILEARKRMQEKAAAKASSTQAQA